MTRFLIEMTAVVSFEVEAESKEAAEDLGVRGLRVGMPDFPDEIAPGVALTVHVDDIINVVDVEEVSA